eukprot:2480767-Rhodomonas_salina.1
MPDPLAGPVTSNWDLPIWDPQHIRDSGNLAQGLSQTQLEKRLTDHGALYWWTVNVLARNRKH